MKYYSICYVSEAADGLLQSEIEDIFRTTIDNNNRNNVKGILLYGFSHFFQVLEGEEQHVKNLFENKIRLDMRHSKVTTIFHRSVIEPIFSGYDSKFNILKTSGDLQSIKKYLSKKTGEASNKVLRILRPFMLYEAQ